MTTEEIAQRCDRSIAFVKGRRHFGTGFLVSPGLVATNAHVLSQERIQDIRAALPATQSESMPTELVLEDPRRDLAILAVPTDLPPLEIESAYRFRRGQDVTVIGNPGIDGKLVLKNAVSRGVMSTEAVIDGQSFYQLNIAINPGNSGGPTIDSSGKVIGVVTLKASRLEATAFCIPSVDLLSATAYAISHLDDADAVLAMHRTRYVAAYLNSTGELYGRVLSEAVSNMDIALASRVDPNQAINQVRKEMSGVLREIETFLTNDFDQEFRHVRDDRGSHRRCAVN